MHSRLSFNKPRKLTQIQQKGSDISKGVFFHTKATSFNKIPNPLYAALGMKASVYEGNRELTLIKHGAQYTPEMEENFWDWNPQLVSEIVH